MKLSALLFPLLALTLVQVANSTQLETCECHQISEIVSTTVQEAAEGLEDRLTLIVNSSYNNASLEKLQNSLTTIVEQFLKPMKQQLDYHLPPPPQTAAPPPQTTAPSPQTTAPSPQTTAPPPQSTAPPQPGNSEDNPASSCKQLHEDYPDVSSGYYWINKTSGSPVRVYCSMDMTCGSETGGWMRIADIDMRYTNYTCPSGLTTLVSPRRLCDVNSNGCISNAYSVQDVQYSRVCGKIIGYENRISYAFFYGTRGIDESYICGVSLTHGQNPRRHIWTFAGASDETKEESSWKCPCINAAIIGSHVPSFVGNDYFCDTALPLYRINYIDAVQTADPLWDGEGCGPTNTCCSFNTPPWFVKDLPSPTADNVEMRVCRPDIDGSTAIETVELYVQ